MNLEELKRTVASIEEQHKNLSDPAWVSQQLQRLKGQYDILTQVIASLEVNKPVEKKENNHAPDKSTN